MHATSYSHIQFLCNYVVYQTRYPVVTNQCEIEENDAIQAPFTQLLLPLPIGLLSAVFDAATEEAENP